MFWNLLAARLPLEELANGSTVHLGFRLALPVRDLGHSIAILGIEVEDRPDQAFPGRRLSGDHERILLRSDWTHGTGPARPAR